MIKPSRFKDLTNRSNPTEAEKKELAKHFEEFQQELTSLQEAWGIAIVPQISLTPIEKPSPIITP